MENTEKIINKIKKVLELSKNNPSEKRSPGGSLKGTEIDGRVPYFYGRSQRY